jgi:hypothetical protein
MEADYDREGGDVARFSQLKTHGGYLAGEVTSALQKSIRRGDERGAVFWASELDLSGYGKYVWKRLKIIASEDIGPAEPELPAQIRALFENWKEIRAEESKFPPWDTNAMLFLTHAVILMARARKSRAVDNALAVMYTADRPHLEIPDYALDGHTARGRAMARSEHDQSTYEESYRLENAVVPDAWYEERKAAGILPYQDPGMGGKYRAPGDPKPKPTAKKNGPNGERHRLLAALHMRYKELGEGGREQALDLASQEFGRQIDSSADLSVDEARWLLNRITVQQSMDV